MEPQARTYILNMVLASVPDLVVGWAAARLTDSGWSGFFVTLVGLQAIYFFFWFKKALWAWLLFWIYAKGQMANEELDATTRIKAAFELGTLNGLKAAGKFSVVLQFSSAAGIALKRYARVASRFAR